MKYFFLIGCLLFAAVINAQRNKIKLGILGVPFFQSGFGMGTIGYERLNKKNTASWQAHFNVAGGSIATDVPVDTRRWGTIEKTFYYKTVAKRISYSFSAFTEIGDRVTTPGYARFEPDSILRKTVVFEINPGASLGLQYMFSKKWGIEMQAGPKLIIANGKKHFINSTNQQKFEVASDEIKAGYMFTGSFYFQF